MLLKGRVAIVTGAAQGIGAAVAKAFVDEGAGVCAVDLRPDGAEALASRLRASPANGERVGSGGPQS